MSISPDAITAALAALDRPELVALQIIDAEAASNWHYPRLDPAQPLLLLDLDRAPDLARLLRGLLQAYPPEHVVMVLHAGARADLKLGDLATGAPAGQGASLFLPPRSGAGAFEALQDVAARLRAPGGCPWDRELTWAKLRSSLLEETHELLAALDADDPTKVLEEQGDLLLQVAMQAQIATEEGRFRLPDVIDHVVEKLIRRHPHVFGDTAVSGTAEVLANWEAIKAAERARNGEKRSPLSSVPAGLPALAQAEAYIDRMSRLRPAETPESPWQALAALPPDAPLPPDLLGDALFALVAWALDRGGAPESALRQANARFAARVASEA